MKDWSQKWYRSGTELIREMQEPLPAEMVAVWYLGQCGVALRFQGKTFLIDPVLAEITDAAGKSRKHFPAPFAPEAELTVDYILCTHNHLDHLHPDTLFPFAKAHPQTHFIVPFPVVPELLAGGIAAERVTGAVQEQPVLQLPGITVTPVEAAHDHYQYDDSGHALALCYVMQLGHTTVFHAGDTVPTRKLVEDLTGFAPVSLAFLPINGRDFVRDEHDVIGNMTAWEAAQFADLIQAELTVPTHFDMMWGNEENPLIFAQYMQDHFPHRRFHILQLGERYLML